MVNTLGRPSPPAKRSQRAQKALTSLHHALQRPCRLLLCAAPTLALTAFFAVPPHASAQDTSSQTPAPIVRVRPRPQAGAPAAAPPDAAPLVNHVQRPHPVNPPALSGAGTATTTGQTSPAATHPRAQSTPTPGQTTTSAGTATHTGPTTSAAAASSPSATPKSEHSAAARIPSLSGGLNRNIVVLDPAHGAQDSGSRIGDNLLEKDVTLAFAFRLRSLLAARGFTVVLTRDSDAATQQTSSNNAPTPLTLDDRAGIANHSRSAACLLLHATGRGNGVHLYTSELDPAPGEATLLPWLTAQAAWVPASQQLERSVSSALGRSHIALVSSAASVRPVDSLACPALVLELAPENSDPHSISDNGYQDRVASAIAGALVFWENQVGAPAKLQSSPSTTHGSAHHHTATTPKAATSTPEAQP